MVQSEGLRAERFRALGFIWCLEFRGLLTG